MDTAIVYRVLPFVVIIIMTIAVTIFGYRAVEKKRIAEYNARLNELGQWINGYEIVNAESPSSETWIITRLNNGKEETITVEENEFKSLKETCPIDSYVRVSPDNKYHIVEDDNKLVIYSPSNDYYDTLNRSKYSSK